MSHCNNMKICVIVMFLVGAFADNLEEDRVYKDTVRMVKECGSRTLTLCLKEKALKFIEQLPNNIEIGNGIRIKQTELERFSRQYMPITLPDETNEREAALDRALMERIVDYLKSHTLELKIPMLMGIVDNENSIEEGRKGGGGYGGGGGGYGGGKKGGKKGGMGAVMMMVMMKSAMMYTLGLKAVAALAFKALLVAKVALTIAGIIALKKLVESNKGHATTYEVIATPHHHEDHGHHDRVYNAGDLVYRGYRTGV